MTTYTAKDNSTIQRALTEAQDTLKAEGSVTITIDKTKDTRRLRQNRLMQQWFKDISISTGNDVIYEAGRCKLNYFVPSLLSSEKAKALLAGEMIKGIVNARGHEYASRALGSSLIPSTSLLTVKEFSEAMNNMQLNEAQHSLTNPALYGLEL